MRRPPRSILPDTLFPYPTRFRSSLLWRFVGRLFSGALGATYPVAAASVADVTEPEERVKQFGVLHAMIGLGLILGPLLGGLAAGHGVRAPFWVAACIATATLIAGYFL